MTEHLIYGAIGFIIGGLVGMFATGKHFANQYKEKIDDLQRENTELRAEIRRKSEKKLEVREKKIEKAERAVDKSLEGLRHPESRKTDTATIEKLSEAYRSDAFNAHFADRVAPDDSDEDGVEFVDIPGEGTTTKESPDDDDDEAFHLTDEERENLQKLGITVGVAGEHDNSGKISVISEEQFKHDVEVKDCATYTYYLEDGVLVDDQTQEVEQDRIGILGQAGMELIEDTDAKVLYIDNEPDDTLYEIIVDHNMSYYRDVLGY